jgi:4-hydroxyphenylpyruvate dioxygenase
MSLRAMSPARLAQRRREEPVPLSSGHREPASEAGVDLIGLEELAVQLDAGRFISETFGSSVQHLAFASSDIFATAAAMAEAGFRVLEIPPNYYDDLASRFGLDASTTERLRAANILYDRDDGGEFFQFYSQMFGEGFFFEIVERRGYRGYGGPNAPFRIAAQKRAMQAIARQSL